MIMKWSYQSVTAGERTTGTLSGVLLGAKHATRRAAFALPGCSPRFGPLDESVELRFAAGHFRRS